MDKTEGSTTLTGLTSDKTIVLTKVINLGTTSGKRVNS